MTAKGLLIPIEYGRRKYPEGINPVIKEIACHFDVKGISTGGYAYSLHTEYSYGRREFCSKFVKDLLVVKSSVKDGVPQLWASNDWAKEFAEFIKIITSGNNDPKIIEIHPPFNDYCDTIDVFLDCYQLFEREIIRRFPGVHILLENRCGSAYRGGRFLISKTTDLVELIGKVKERGLRLRITLDSPQLISAYGGVEKINQAKLEKIFSPLLGYEHYIEGLHLWGKKKSEAGRTVSHIGTLDTLFADKTLKAKFLSIMKDLFADGVPRYFVPEVNSGDLDLKMIVEDLINSGFSFVER